MKKYNWFQKFSGSLVPSDLYNDCQNEKFYKSFLYVLLLLLLLSSFSGTYLGMDSRNAINKTLADYDSGVISPINYSQSEGLIYEEGKASVIDYFELPFIIDPHKVLPANTLYDYASYVLFGKDSITFYVNNIEFEKFDYKSRFPFDINSESLRQILSVTATLIIPIYIVINFFFNIFSFLYSSLILMFMTNILLMFNGMRIKMSSLYQKVMYAMTVPLLWNTFTLVVKKPMPQILTSFVVYVYPTIILMTVFRRLKNDVLKNTK